MAASNNTVASDVNAAVTILNDQHATAGGVEAAASTLVGEETACFLEDPPPPVEYTRKTTEGPAGATRGGLGRAAEGPRPSVQAPGLERARVRLSRTKRADIPGESIEEKDARSRDYDMLPTPAPFIPTYTFEGKMIMKPKAEQDEQAEEEEEEEEFSKVVEKVKTAVPARYDALLGTSPPFIYVVPRDIAEGTKDAYEPAVVCIGPLFHQMEREKEARNKLESYKWCCVRKLIVNAAAAGIGTTCWIEDVHAPLLRKCLDTMRDLEPQILASYGVSISMDAIGGSRKMALMMLLDGCFLLHRLLKYARLARRSSSTTVGVVPNEDDDDDDDDWTQVFGRCGVWGVVTSDLLLISNQIPFFLLRALLVHLKSRASERDHVLIDGGLRLFASLCPVPAGTSSTIDCSKVLHLLHLFYLSIDISLARPPPPPESSRHAKQAAALPPEHQGWVPCAKELVEAGVRFRAKMKATTFLDVSFRGSGVLEIPPLELYDYSESLFRNLIAFEQTYPRTPGHVTAYAIFMDCLIKTPEDMRLLHQSGVLVSHMNGDRDVATGFFSRVCAQVRTSTDRNFLDKVMGDVVRYQSGRWPRWRAALVRNYFSNPWVTTSLAAAFFLLVMTVLQTFFTIYAYFKPPGPK